MTPRPREIRIGDLVRVLPDAPAAYRPGNEGTVEEIRRLDDEGIGCRITGAPSGAIARVCTSERVTFDVPIHLLMGIPGDRIRE